MQVFIHSPHRRLTTPSSLTTPTSSISASSTDSDITLLSIGQHVTSLAAGRLDGELERDVLVVGSQTNVQAYDVETNSQLFYKEVCVCGGIQDGVWTGRVECGGGVQGGMCVCGGGGGYRVKCVGEGLVCTVYDIL